MNKKKYIFLLLLMPYFINATVVWNNVMAAGTANALNQDVEINGETWLPAETVTIQALLNDVTVSMINGSHLIHGSTNGTDATTVQFIVAYPWTINILVTEDLRFIGSEDILTDIGVKAPIIIQARDNSTPEIYGTIQWVISEHKNLMFGPDDNQDIGGAELQIVCNSSYNMPRHIIKVNGSQDNPHIFFYRNSSLTILQETFIDTTNPFNQYMFFDVANGQPRNHHVYFKDGSGLFFETAQITT